MRSIRGRMTFSNVISVVALFVALGGTAVAGATLAKNSVGAKQIKKNAVRASEIKKNAVRAAEVRRNAVGASELRSNAVAGGDVADGTIGSGDLGDDSVGSAEVIDDSLGAADINGASLDLEIGPDAFARVGATGTLDAGTPVQNKNVVQANVQHDAVAGATTTGPGVYCFGGLPFQPRTAMVVSDSAMAINTTNLIASVAVQRGNTLGNCNAQHQQARVSLLAVDQTNAPTLTNHGFYIWFEG